MSLPLTREGTAKWKLPRWNFQAGPVVLSEGCHEETGGLVQINAWRHFQMGPGGFLAAWANSRVKTGRCQHDERKDEMPSVIWFTGLFPDTMGLNKLVLSD